MARITPNYVELACERCGQVIEIPAGTMEVPILCDDCEEEHDG